MHLPSRTATTLLAVALVALVAAGAVLYGVTRSSTGGGARSAGSGPGAPPGPVNTITIGNATAGRSIPAGFVGLTTEYRGLPAYAGTNPSALDPVFEQLIRNLAPGQSPVLRIGGDSTDWTWWPVPGMTRPPGVKYTLTPNWLRVARTLTEALDAHLILGINFEADNGRVAAAESQAMIGGIGRSRIEAIELGNEPELYAAFPWYKLPDGRHVRGRPSTYDYPAFLQDFSNISRSLPRGVTLAGPSMGSSLWIPLIGQFMTANPRVSLVTLHRYPLKRCSSATTVTIPELLSSTSTVGLAATVAQAVASAHARRIPLRVDEMSGISCGGEAGVSNSFASALWSLEAMFAMAQVGVDGVNIQTTPGSFNELFKISSVSGAWQADVHPSYYGLMMFAQAAPAGSRLLRLSGAPGAEVSAWATRAPGGDVRVVLINDAATTARVVKVRVPAMSGPAMLERLQAPSVRAESGVTLGGQGFGAETATGQLAGTPTTTVVKPAAGGFLVSLPAASAAMLTLSPAG